MNTPRKTSRKGIDAVLLQSRRRCALCYAAGDETPKIGNVAHIVPLASGGGHEAENLVFLCMEHHYELDQASIGPSSEVVRAARDSLYRAVAAEPMVPSARPKVLVVHGRDDTAKFELLSFLEAAGTEPVVLSDHPTLGQTALEKLDQAADAGYAVVVLTPDDRRETQAAVRQNVILELGFLVGRLGRHRVCALYKASVELPSDFLGILYTEMDAAGRWRSMLARELRAAGVVVGEKT
jgi:predicted nucleotide-binding protein